ncbi:MAG: hypothetical protein WAM42_08660 [Candidatus Nitrosopolaris sp.]
MKEYNKRYHSRAAVSLVNYFKRYADIFAFLVCDCAAWGAFLV